MFSIFASHNYSKNYIIEGYNKRYLICWAEVTGEILELNKEVNFL